MQILVKLLKILSLKIKIFFAQLLVVYIILCKISSRSVELFSWNLDNLLWKQSFEKNRLEFKALLLSAFERGPFQGCSVKTLFGSTRNVAYSLEIFSKLRDNTKIDFLKL